MLSLGIRKRESVNLYVTTGDGRKRIGKIMVVDIRADGRVNLGIELPKNIQIVRAEIDPHEQEPT